MLFLTDRKKILSSAFVPPSTGIAFWGDASDTNSANIVQSANNVSQWTDKSGNNNHLTQGTAANQPKTAQNTINGLNTITADGSNDFMTFASAIPRASGYSIMAVVKANDTAAVKGLISGVGVNAPSVEYSATEQVLITQVSGVTLLTGSSSGLVNSHILYAKTVPAGNQAWINGVSEGSNATAPSYAYDITQIFRRSSGLNFDGYIGEMFIYTGALSQADANTLGSYLSAKWGISWTSI